METLSNLRDLEPASSEHSVTDENAALLSTEMDTETDPEKAIPSISNDTSTSLRFKVHHMFEAHSGQITGYIQAFLIFLVPSFISGRWGPLKVRPEPRGTAFLDGARGVAAWAVMNSHLAPCITKSAGAVWGEGGHYHQFFRLPGIRLLYNGNFAVGVFFVISGFALSISPLKAMQTTPRDPGLAMKKLASAIFRRPLRLLLPSWASTAIIFLLTRSHYISSIKARVPELAKLMDAWFPIKDFAPPLLPSFWAQLTHLAKSNMLMLVIFKDYTDVAGGNLYNLVLWTVAIELRASLILYLVHATFFFIRRPARIAIVVGIIAFGVAIQAYDIPLFLAGYLMAEDYQKQSENRKDSAHGPKKRLHRLLSIFWPTFWWLIFLLGCYVGSYAAWETDRTPLYSWIEPFTPFHYEPKFRFWSGFGAVLYLLGISKTGLLQKLYCCRPIQYLGKISFALYLVHLWIVQGVGELIFYYAWSVTGNTSVIQHLIGFVIGYGITFLLLVWLSDIFWRTFDEPSVKLAFRLQKWLFTED